MFIFTATASWYGRLSRAVKIIGWFGVISAAIVSCATALPIMEPYWFAHRGYVRTYSAPASDHAALVRIQLRQNKDERQQLIDEVPKRELELQSDQAKQLPEYRALVQDRVDRVKARLKEIEADDNNLFKEKH
jgi:hypothetical protein